MLFAGEVFGIDLDIILYIVCTKKIISLLYNMFEQYYAAFTIVNILRSIYHRRHHNIYKQTVSQ